MVSLKKINKLVYILNKSNDLNIKNASFFDEMLSGYDSVSPMITDFIESIKMWLDKGLSEFGFESFEAAKMAAENGDETAQKIVAYADVRLKQIMLIKSAVKPIISQIEELDNKAADLPV